MRISVTQGFNFSTYRVIMVTGETNIVQMMRALFDLNEMIGMFYGDEV